MAAALALTVSAAWVQSCGEKDPKPVEEPEPIDDPVPQEPEEQKPDFDPNAKITFTREPKFNFEGDGGTINMVFTCTGYWELQVPAEATWITAARYSGEGSSSRQSLALTAEPNPDESSRQATLVLEAGGDSKKITVTQSEAVLVITASDVPDYDKIYIPQEFRGMDMFRSDSKWSFVRSRQSQHFIVFWDIKYGSRGTPTPSECKVSSMRVDIDDLLKKAEEFYDLNIHTLGFADEPNSVVSRYKMIICLLYQSEWLATGSGYDNKIGALWVNPSTCKPVGSTIGHEIGHTFQYMVYCDYLLNNPDAPDNSHGPGWRYGFERDGSGGNAFWEQTAQWQSMQLPAYRAEAFSGWFGEYYTSTHLHVLHERPRYANYFIHWWWVEENGGDVSFIGRLWNLSRYPEDPVETYMRLMDYDVSRMNDSMWGYAAHMLTWDTDEIRSYGTGNIGRTAITSVSRVDEDWWQIAASKAPETTGSNAIRLSLPEEGQREISVTFKGLRSLEGCLVGDAALAGWRYGFVSYNSDKTTTYSDIYSTEDETVSWSVPENCSKLWFVVTGAPSAYERHPWGAGGSDHDGEGDSKDTKWPWKAQFEGTKPYGK